MKTISLIDVDKTFFPNLALMKIATYYNESKINLNFPLEKADLTYISCVFTWNKDKISSFPSGIIGGSGINTTRELDINIEYLCPDYALYNIDYGLGFITRGCPRKCSFCIVPKKEGKLKFWQDPEAFKNLLSNKMVFLDNNFLAYQDHEKMLHRIIDHKWRIDFCQGLDLRLLNKSNVKLLAKISFPKRIRFAWDFMKDEAQIRQGIELLKDNIAFSRVMMYMLTGFDTSLEEDKYRFHVLQGYKITPFVMLYKRETQPRIKRAFASYGNIPRINKRITFEQWLQTRKVKGCIGQ